MYLSTKVKVKFDPPAICADAYTSNKVMTMTLLLENQTWEPLKCFLKNNILKGNETGWKKNLSSWQTNTFEVCFAFLKEVIVRNVTSEMYMIDLV